MKVLLVNPAPEHYTRARCAPLGVLSIASYLEAKGHEVKVLNRAIKSTDINTMEEVIYAIKKNEEDN